MLPVSGAEQLKTSEAQGTRPMISASGAYSRFVSPAPCGESGRNRFHSPAARAFGFSSSISRVGVQRAPRRVFSSTSSWKRRSTGYTCSFMNAVTRSRSSWRGSNIEIPSFSPPAIRIAQRRRGPDRLACRVAGQEER